uniref:Uncharacterized protein n=1 Tax=Arundo donax TaxID=35708 RepID=A0A0A9AP23_ARUDO
MQVFDRRCPGNLFNKCNFFVLVLLSNNFFVSLMWVVVVKKRTKTRVGGLS